MKKMNYAGSILQRALGTGRGALLVVALLAAASFAATTRSEVAPSLPKLGRVADFSLRDQDGAPVTRSSLAGEPWIASFLFTRCPTVCPIIVGRLKKLDALASAGDTPLRLVSISVDPEHDEQGVLRSYAESHDADWSMLTGSEAAVESLAESFAVALEGEADPNELNFGILHSGHLVLVDGEGTIRGYYPSGDEDVEARILADSRRLQGAG